MSTLGKKISINFGRVNAARTGKERKKPENQVLPRVRWKKKGDILQNMGET